MIVFSWDTRYYTWCYNINIGRRGSHRTIFTSHHIHPDAMITVCLLLFATMQNEIEEWLIMSLKITINSSDIHPHRVVEKDTFKKKVGRNVRILPVFLPIPGDLIQNIKAKIVSPEVRFSKFRKKKLPEKIEKERLIVVFHCFFFFFKQPWTHEGNE